MGAFLKVFGQVVVAFDDFPYVTCPEAKKRANKAADFCFQFTMNLWSAFEKL